MKCPATFLFYMVLLTTTIHCSKDDIQHKGPSCRIIKMFASDYNGNNIEATFSYTYWGAPHTIKMNHPGSDAPNHYFLYDSSKRLIGHLKGWEVDFRGFPDTMIWVYHRYMLQGNAIFGDTVFNMIE